MITNSSPYGVKVSHIPSGESQTVNTMRSHHKSKIAAINILKNRINYKQKENTEDINKEHLYILDDPMCLYPDNLKDYKVK